MVRKQKAGSLSIFFLIVVLVLFLGLKPLASSVYATPTTQQKLVTSVGQIAQKAKNAASALINKVKNFVSPQSSREDLVNELIPKFAKAFQEACMEGTGKSACGKNINDGCCRSQNCSCCPYCEGGWRRNVNSVLDRADSDKNISSLGFFLLGGKDQAAPIIVDQDMINKYCSEYRCTIGAGGQVMLGINEWNGFTRAAINNINFAALYAVGLTENVGTGLSPVDLTNAHTGKDLLNFARKVLGYSGCIDEEETYRKQLNEAVVSMSIYKGMYGTGDPIVGDSLNQKLFSHWNTARTFWFEQANRYYKILMNFVREHPEYNFLGSNILNLTSNPCERLFSKVSGGINLITDKKTPEFSVAWLVMWNKEVGNKYSQYINYYQWQPLNYEIFLSGGEYFPGFFALANRGRGGFYNVGWDEYQEPLIIKEGENRKVNLTFDLRVTVTPTPTPSCVCCLETPIPTPLPRPSVFASLHRFFGRLFGSPQSAPQGEGVTCCLPEQCREGPTSTPTLTPTPTLSPIDCSGCVCCPYDKFCSGYCGWRYCSPQSHQGCCVSCTDQPTLTPTPTSRPLSTRTPSPTPTPTPTPRTGWEPFCGCTDNGCTPPNLCRKFYQEDICFKNTNGRLHAPCCIRDDNCSGGWSGCGDSACGTNQPCHRNQKGTSYCQQFPECGNGSPKPPILRVPNGASLPLGSSVRLWWWDYGADVYKGKCSPELGSTPEAQWTKWGYACWGYVCAKTSFPQGVVLPEWRYYEVYVRREGTADFRKVSCANFGTDRIDNIPNPARLGEGIGEKSQCVFNLDPNDTITRTYEWKVRAGYRVNTGFETYTDSEIRKFTLINYNTKAACSSDNKSVALSWNNIPNATGYTLVVNNQKIVDLNTNSYTLSLSSISPADTYHWWIHPYYQEVWNVGPAAGGPDFTCGQTTPTLTPIPTWTPIPESTNTPTSIPQGSCEYCRAYDDENLSQTTDLSSLRVNQKVFFTTRGSLTSNLKARFRINMLASESWCQGNGLSLVNNWCETTLKHNDEYYVPYTFLTSGRFTIESMVFNVNGGWY